MSVVLSNSKTHLAVKALEESGVRLGPCAAAALGALWKIREAGGDEASAVPSPDAVGVLLGT